MQKCKNELVNKVQIYLVCWGNPGSILSEQSYLHWCCRRGRDESLGWTWGLQPTVGLTSSSWRWPRYFYLQSASMTTLQFTVSIRYISISTSGFTNTYAVVPYSTSRWRCGPIKLLKEQENCKQSPLWQFLDVSQQTAWLAHDSPGLCGHFLDSSKLFLHRRCSKTEQSE